jgi:hypothetical protein
MRVDSLSDLAPAPARVVVINVRTDLAASVALLSARAVLPEVPVLLIDCDPVSAGDSALHGLAERRGVDVVVAAVRPHGIVLDELFRELDDGLLVLVDSDADIRDAGFARRCLEVFAGRQVFGAGFFKRGPLWIADDSGAAPGTGMFADGPWTPFMVLRVAHVRDALAAGRTFQVHTVYNEVRWSPRLSRRIATRLQNQYAPHGASLPHLPRGAKRWLAETSLPGLRWARGDFHGQRPNFIHYDTAAEVYEFLRYERSLTFAGLHVRLAEGQVHHYGGVTRGLLDPAQLGRRWTRSVDDVEAELRRRVHELGEPGYPVQPDGYSGDSAAAGPDGSSGLHPAPGPP